LKKILNVTKVLILIVTLSVMFISTAYANNTTASCPTREYISDTKQVTFPTSSANPIESVTVDGTFIGAESNIRIIDISNISAIAARTAGRVGIPVEISTTGAVKEATITFNYNPSLLAKTKPENLAIGWYNEKQGKVEILDSKLDINQNMVSVVTSHFSEYMLIDLAQWYAAWREELVTSGSRTTSTLVQSNNIDIVFVIDDSGSMTTNDKGGLRFAATYNFIRQLYDNDGFAVIKFSDSSQTIADYTLKGNTYDWINLENSIKGSSSGGTNIGVGLNSAISLLTTLPSDRQATMKRIILLTDGQGGMGSSLENAKQNNIIIDTIGLSANGSTSSFDEALLMRIANETGGKYYFSLTQDLISTFNRIASESYIVDDGDTDGDGIPDDVEIGGMRNKNGQIIHTDPHKYDTDGDGLSDGEEVGQLNYNTDANQRNRQNGVTQFIYYDMKSDPTKADTDDDGLIDPVDPRPWFNDSSYPNSMDLKISGEKSFSAHDIYDTTYGTETCNVKVDINNSYIINPYGNRNDIDTIKESKKIKNVMLYIITPKNVSLDTVDDSIISGIIVNLSSNNNSTTENYIKIGDLEVGDVRSIDLILKIDKPQNSGSYDIKFRITADNAAEESSTYKISYNTIASNASDTLTKAKYLINYNPYQNIKNTDSFPKVLVSNLEEDGMFKGFSIAYQALNLSAFEAIKSIFDSPSEYYELVLLDVLRSHSSILALQKMEYERYIDTIAETNNDFFKLIKELDELGKIDNNLSEKINKLNVFSSENVGELLKGIKLDQDMIDKVFGNTGFLDKYDIDIDYIGLIFLPAKTLYSVAQKVSTISVLSKLSDMVILVLEDIKSQPAQNPYLTDAIDKVIKAINEAKKAKILDYLVKGSLAGIEEIFTFAADTAITGLLSASAIIASEGVAKVASTAMLAVDVVKLAVNAATSADGLSEKYLILKNFTIIENSLIQALNNNESYVKKNNVGKAELLVAEAEFYKSFELYGLNVVDEFSKDATKDALISKLVNIPKNIINFFTGGKSDYEKVKDTINYLRNKITASIDSGLGK